MRHIKANSTGHPVDPALTTMMLDAETPLSMGSSAAC
jgi:hypothetical protein